MPHSTPASSQGGGRLIMFGLDQSSKLVFQKHLPEITRQPLPLSGRQSKLHFPPQRFLPSKEEGRRHL